MTSSKDSLTREERLAEKLRENLKRRKSQARAHGRTKPGQEDGIDGPALPKQPEGG